MSTSSTDVLIHGPSNVQQRWRYMNDESHSPVVVCYTPIERAFNSGYDFRAFYEFTVLDNTEQVIKVVSTANAVVYSLQVELETQSVNLELYSGGTPGGSFSTSIAVLQSNQQNTVPPRTTTITMTTGGTHTGGTLVEKYHVDSSKHTAVTTATDDQPLGFAPGTFYIKVVNVGNGTATGIFRTRWEERP